MPRGVFWTSSEKSLNKLGRRCDSKHRVDGLTETKDFA